MSPTRPTRSFAVLLFLLAVALPAAADRPVTERVEADSHGTVEISNVTGSLTVRGWDRAEVSVEGTVGEHVEEVRVSSRGSRTVIEVKLPRGRTWGRRDYEADLEIRVPIKSGVETSTVSASQSVEGVEGALDLTTVSGNVTVGGRPASIEVESVSGKVQLDAETGTLRASTVSGVLDLRGRAREVKASSVSGRVELGTDGAERIEVESVSTDIAIDLDASATTRLSASTHSGSLTLRLAPGASAEISASTFSGRITNELGPPAERPRYGPGSNLSFTLGRGDGRFELSTFSGSIRIASR